MAPTYTAPGYVQRADLNPSPSDLSRLNSESLGQFLTEDKVKQLHYNPVTHSPEAQPKFYIYTVKRREVFAEDLDEDEDGGDGGNIPDPFQQTQQTKGPPVTAPSAATATATATKGARGRLDSVDSSGADSPSLDSLGSPVRNGSKDNDNDEDSDAGEELLRGRDLEEEMQREAKVLSLQKRARRKLEGHQAAGNGSQPKSQSHTASSSSSNPKTPQQPAKPHHLSDGSTLGTTHSFSLSLSSPLSFFSNCSRSFLSSSLPSPHYQDCCLRRIRRLH